MDTPGSRIRFVSNSDNTVRTPYIFCPACKTVHLFDERWTFNGDLQKPTFNPSMLIHEHRNDNYWQPRCHSFVRDGQIQYLGDCTHDLKNQTMDLPEITDEMW